MSRRSNPLTFEPEETLSNLTRAVRDAINTSVTPEDVASSTHQPTTIPTTPSANFTLIPEASNSTLTLNPDTSNATSTLTPEAPNSTLTLTSKMLNVTSTIISPTEHHSTSNTSIAPGATTALIGDNDDSNMGGTVAAVVITVFLVIIFIAAVVYLYMRRRCKSHQKPDICFQPIRKRRSSTSDSRRALEEIEVEDPDKMADHNDDHLNGGSGNRRAAKQQEQDELDAFTIDDLEEPEDDVSRGDEYYYDEVFGHSQFEDEATQNAVRQLYSTGDDQREEELLDFDFETLGIKIEDYKIDPSRRIVNL